MMIQGSNSAITTVIPLLVLVGVNTVGAWAGKTPYGPQMCQRRCKNTEGCLVYKFLPYDLSCHVTNITFDTEPKDKWMFLHTVTKGPKDMLGHSTPRSALPIALKKGKMTWAKAEEVCDMYNSSKLLIINSEIKQSSAVKMAKDSGLQMIAIGVFKRYFRWVDRNHQYLVYTAWATGEPNFIRNFAGLSKKAGYKWVTTSSNKEFDGCLCKIQQT